MLFLVCRVQAAVIVSPGGGYGFLAIDREGTDIAAWLNDIGVSAYVLKYRVPGRAWLPFGAAPLMCVNRPKWEGGWRGGAETTPFDISRHPRCTILPSYNPGPSSTLP